jgi:hypothetical protein
MFYGVSCLELEPLVACHPSIHYTGWAVFYSFLICLWWIRWLSLWNLLLFADLFFLLQWWQNVCKRVVWRCWGQRESQTWCVWEVSPGALDVPKSCCYGISSLFLCTKFQLCYFCPEMGDNLLSLLINPTLLLLQNYGLFIFGEWHPTKDLCEWMAW